jgi:hypothetical protein
MFGSLRRLMRLDELESPRFPASPHGGRVIGERTSWSAQVESESEDEAEEVGDEIPVVCPKCWPLVLATHAADA